MVLITGASGRVARRAADLLRGRGASLRLMSHRPDSAQLPGAETLASDFGRPHTLGPAFEGIDVAFIVLAQGKPDERALMHRNAFEAAARAGVCHIVYLSLKGASQTSLYPFCRDNQAIERFLADTGVAHTIPCIAFYQDMFVDKIGPSGALWTLGGQVRGAFISREDSAWAVAAAATGPPGRIHEVTGPELISVGDMVRRLSAISGIAFCEEVETVARIRGDCAAPPNRHGCKILRLVGSERLMPASNPQPLSTSKALSAAKRRLFKPIWARSQTGSQHAGSAHRAGTVR